jgi:aryl-alcohol dehydrogenase-like predicted oxidoreductase
MATSPGKLAVRAFGRTGLSVSALGLGAGEIGDAALDEHEVEALLRAAVDCGITLIDTARSYGLSEARIGRFLAPVRDQVVLSTKVGYGVAGVPDWTGECVRLGIDQALERLATDRIDIVHLHSCPTDVLERGDVVTALHDARRAGKLRSAAYSGDNEALAWAVASGQFDSLQLSFNVCDQRAATVIERAHAAGLGVIAKRPLANAPWRFADRPVGHEAELYWMRWRALESSPTGADPRHAGEAVGVPTPRDFAPLITPTGADPRPAGEAVGVPIPRDFAPLIAPGELAWDELAVRFAAHCPGVSSAIVGTRQIPHLCHNTELVARGPLPAALDATVRARFEAVGADWPGRI